jgi:hypothetical protein
VNIGTIEALARAYRVPLHELLGAGLEPFPSSLLADSASGGIHSQEVHPEWLGLVVYEVSDPGAATPLEDAVVYVPRQHLARAGVTTDQVRCYSVTGSCLLSDEVQRFRAPYIGDYVLVDITRESVPGESTLAWWKHRAAGVFFRAGVDVGIFIVRGLSRQSETLRVSLDELLVIGPVIWRGG